MMNAVINEERERHYPEITSGMWKFGEKIKPKQLVEMAKKWAEEDINKRYTDLHVRKCSKDQHGIGFKYILCNGENDPNPENYNVFFDRMSDMLRRNFGNDFAGWDISFFTHIII